MPQWGGFYPLRTLLTPLDVKAPIVGRRVQLRPASVGEMFGTVLGVTMPADGVPVAIVRADGDTDVDAPFGVTSLPLYQLRDDDGRDAVLVWEHWRTPTFRIICPACAHKLTSITPRALQAHERTAGHRVAVLARGSSVSSMEWREAELRATNQTVASRQGYR